MSYSWCVKMHRNTCWWDISSTWWIVDMKEYMMTSGSDFCLSFESLKFNCQVYHFYFCHFTEKLVISFWIPHKMQLRIWKSGGQYFHWSAFETNQSMICRLWQVTQIAFALASYCVNKMCICQDGIDNAGILWIKSLGLIFFLEGKTKFHFEFELILWLSIMVFWQYCIS